MKYSKIQTLFKRDDKNIIIPDQFTYPEFEYLKDNKWECTEKIDGTNIRIELDFNVHDDGVREVNVNFKGRTDEATIPAHLYRRLKELFDNVNWLEIFDITSTTSITLYGEGYGTKIQKRGNYISSGVDFILFDVKVDNLWLQRDAVEDVANKLNIKVVPLIGYMTIPEAVEYVRRGFKSTIAENKDYDAESLVLKTTTGLLRRNGERLITKIKTVDFRKYRDSQVMKS